MYKNKELEKLREYGGSHRRYLVVGVFAHTDGVFAQGCGKMGSKGLNSIIAQVSGCVRRLRYLR